MKKILIMILTAMMLLVALGCNRAFKNDKVQNNGQKYNIAVISAGSYDEEFNGFFDGAYECFRNIGYSVDRFAAGNDEAYLESILENSLGGGYIGVILYDLNEYADEYIEKAKAAGVHVSVFSKDSYVHENVSNVCYDQEQMTKISIDELLTRYRADMALDRAVVKAWYDEADVVNLSRAQFFDSYMTQNGINVSVNIYEDNLNEKSGLSRTAKRQLTDLPQTGMNYIWAVDDTMAAMIAEYLKTGSINNAIVVNIGMSQQNIHKMYEYETYWPAACVVSYTASGKVCGDILSKAIEQKPVEEVTYIPSFMIYSSELEKNSNVEIIDEKANLQM